MLRRCTAAPRWCFSLPTPTADYTSWLVATKLHPPRLRGDTIRRLSLEEALRQSVLANPLTLLSAPAGYGKTTLLAALPHLLPEHRLAWVSLDEDDNDPVRFLALLTAALGRLHPACGQSVWPWLAGGMADGAALKRAVGGLINDLLTHLPGPLVLVLDDLHLVTDPAIFIALEYLLDHIPPQMGLAVGTRHDPPLRLARLAARRQLGELRRPDLGFSPDEARHLLNDTLRLRLTAEEVAALQERTEGWPAGLCLLAGPLGRLGEERRSFMAALAHTEQHALEFLAAEVLRDLPDELRLFLMRTAVLAELTPAACQAVTGRPDAAALLEQLYHQNLAIASIGQGEGGEAVYRYHALLTRLLLRQLERELPAELPDLHRRAAAVQRTPGRAIGHYLAAGLPDQAAALMIESGLDLLHRGMSETIRAWYNALPATVQEGQPRLKLLLGRCEIQRGDYGAAAVALDAARTAFVAAGDQAGESEAVASLMTMAVQSNDRPLAATLVARAAVLPGGPPGQVVTGLVRAWLLLTEGDLTGCRTAMAPVLALAPRTANRVVLLLGVVYQCAPLTAVPGCLELVERFCAEAEPHTLPHTALRMGLDELAAWPLLLRGQADEALSRAQAADGLRQRLGGWPVIGCDAALQLAVLHLARGEREAAGGAIDRLLGRLERAPLSRLAFYLHGAGRTLALLGRLPEARALARRLGAHSDGLPFTTYLTGHLEGLIALLDGRRAEAEPMLAEAAALEAGLPSARVAGSARLLLARLWQEQGRTDAARSQAAAVLAEWEQAGVPGCALLDGGVIGPLLALVALQRERPALHLPEPLTAREQEVLRLIVAGQTNRQIGQQLYITEETVKTHVVRILRKLDVTSRTQAAIRGRELGY